MKLPDVLEEVDGEIRVKGHRITLFHIVSTLNERWVGPHAMVHYFPTLSLDEIEQVLDFYHGNQAEVVTYMKAYRAELDRLEATTPRGPSREELIRRLSPEKRAQLGLTLPGDG